METVLLPGFLDGILAYKHGRVAVLDLDRLRAVQPSLAEACALEKGPRAARARFLVRSAAQELGAYPASIHPLYLARGRGEIPLSFTVPALNLRALPFEAARAAFRAARELDAAALIFEISRAEIAFTDQAPGEYAANILAASMAEGYQGPVFIQGDHFQVSPSRYHDDADAEIQALRELAAEAIRAGFYNLDVDASTLVDLDQPTLTAQQRLNSQFTANLTAFIRSLDPAGITVSVGGEIGEVGRENTIEAELRAFMQGFNETLGTLAPGAPGLSKLSIQTGTSHGGVMLPDGRISEANVDFETIRRLGRVARDEYGLGGVVQHGASTLPVTAFPQFVEAGAAEIHLATSFTQTLYEHLPESLKGEMHAYLDEHMAHERSPGMTEAQFYHQTRKHALGPFKRDLWLLEPENKAEISQAWERQFRELFTALGLEGTRQVVERWVPQVFVPNNLNDHLSAVTAPGNARDLAD